MSFDKKLIPPKMAKKEHVTKIHNIEIEDPYYWFRQKDLPEVINHLKAENEYTKKQLEPYTELQNELWNELKNRIKENDETYPIKHGDYYYYSKEIAGQEYKVYCRKHKSREAQEEVILDLNILAKDQDYLQLGDIKITLNNQIMAYSLDFNGSEEFQVFFKDLQRNELLDLTIKNTSPDYQWSNDNKTFYYLELDKNHRPNKLFKLDIEHGSSPPTLIFEEKDPDYHMSLDKSRTNNYIFINIFSHATSEVWYLEANNSQSECLCVFPRKKSVIYNVEDSGYKSFFIHSNENAVNFKVIEVPINNMEDIKEVIPHNPQVYCSEIEVFEDRIILLERENGLKRFRDFQYKENKSTIINVPEENCEISSYVNFDFNSSNFYFSFSSLITPPSVLSYNFKDQSVEFCKTKDIPYYDKSKYTTKRVFATGHDGVQIPISLVYSKDLTLDGNSPCYLYGYGSYGLNISPFFRSNIFSLIDRGFIYAIAHIRGSSTMGREWYENGKLQNKKNTFLDFIAAAEHLTSNNYTYEKGIVICGGSAGGMLVGTTANLRPELFKAVVAHVPFVDVLNTMLDETLPLTTIEYDEWGNPNNLEDFKNIKSYSTYDNVEAKDYPHMFITAGLNDPRVTYWEPAKWVAKLRELKTDKNVILLKTNLEAGHGGKTGRYESLKEYAQEYCFILVAFEMY